MTQRRKISDDELIEIIGGTDIPITDVDAEDGRERRESTGGGGDGARRPSPGGGANDPTPEGGTSGYSDF